ncbi:hypothetical protein V1477_006573 [Vespula maculifrons]|uniref:Uncharacterized protein n=1 Tax=Vespula maculifrons TaxID=7453 RepID=A0ABD2CJG7_VESMC
MELEKKREREKEEKGKEKRKNTRIRALKRSDNITMCFYDFTIDNNSTTFMDFSCVSRPTRSDAAYAREISRIYGVRRFAEYKVSVSKYADLGRRGLVRKGSTGVRGKGFARKEERRSNSEKGRKSGFAMAKIQASSRTHSGHFPLINNDKYECVYTARDKSAVCQIPTRLSLVGNAEIYGTLCLILFSGFHDSRIFRHDPETAVPSR